MSILNKIMLLLKVVLQCNNFNSANLAQDYNKPLIIPVGSDSLNLISGNIDGSSQNMNYDAWKRTFSNKFPQVKSLFHI